MRRDWHHQDIAAEIRKTGITMKALALRHGYNESAVRAALRQHWPAVELIVGQHLGVSPSIIWPSRYNANGEPLRPIRRRRRHKRDGQCTHRKSGGSP